MRVLGAVLIGGASRRMGQDKALVEIDGVPMARLVADALQNGGAERVALVGGNPTVAASLWLDAVPDGWSAIGPLGGIASAVKEGRETVHRAEPLLPPTQVAIVVAACDQPALGASLIASLVAALRSAPPEVVVAVPVTPDGRRQPFPTVWRATAGPMLEHLIASGARRADAGIGAENAVLVDARAEELRDIDTPADLDADEGGLRWAPTGADPVGRAGGPAAPADPARSEPMGRGETDRDGADGAVAAPAVDVGPALVWDPAAHDG